MQESINRSMMCVLQLILVVELRKYTHTHTQRTRITTNVVAPLFALRCVALSLACLASLLYCTSNYLLITVWYVPPHLFSSSLRRCCLSLATTRSIIYLLSNFKQWARSCILRLLFACMMHNMRDTVRTLQ
jgi:hypothetical protein